VTSVADTYIVSASQITDKRNVYKQNPLSSPSFCQFQNTIQTLQTVPKPQNRSSSPNSLVSSPFYSESTRKHHGTKEKTRLVHLIGLFLHFSRFFCVFLTVTIRGLGHGFSLHVVVAWFKFDFVLLLLLIYVDLAVKLG
jgi:hypothetical protein